MIKPIKSLQKLPIEVDLTGPDGNIFVLLGMAVGWCKANGTDFEWVKEFILNHSYEENIIMLDSHFGYFVTFYR